MCDSQEVDVQVLVNFINHRLGNYGKTVDLERPSQQRQADDGSVLQLIEELKSGQVAALFMAGIDLTQNLPDRETLAEAVGKVPLTVSWRNVKTTTPRCVSGSAPTTIRLSLGWTTNP